MLIRLGEAARRWLLPIERLRRTGVRLAGMRLVDRALRPRWHRGGGVLRGVRQTGGRWRGARRGGLLSAPVGQRTGVLGTLRVRGQADRWHDLPAVLRDRWPELVGASLVRVLPTGLSRRGERVLTG
ncbi:hypothetical protein UO65_1475 [Actinokineospora spheciospongiae]|uniref:Uncharacterized protein n=1 Tax=Actinokineospora spheciospongiae TaxID=909613 RepID=W7J2U8_9PSEU|nr:hypothetical protein [Actinokineospora spheciospongiae]EWC63261.1 hypothetical protein UO65_1475 [Actinokineospora spheciospongiae]